jgi:hypothetical protein
MNLGRQLEGILEYCEGIKEDTLEKVLRETIEYCIRDYEEKYERAKKDYQNAQKNQKDNTDISSYHFHAMVYETRYNLLKKIIRGETTFSETLGKVNLCYNRRDFNNVLLHAFSDLLGSGCTKKQECERLDGVIKTLYNHGKVNENWA